MQESNFEELAPQVKILLVDDEPAILNALKRLLFDFECDLRMADGGERALELLHEEPADIIISDMRMAGMDGVEFLSEVANQWPDSERILLTGFADLESTIGAINKGKINYYLEKPWDDDRLRRIVSKGMELSHTKYRTTQLEKKVRDQNIKLHQWNSRLESLVEERTRDLQKSNAQLTGSLELINKNYQNTVQVFSSLIEQRMGPNLISKRSLTWILRELAVVLGVDETETRALLYAGILRNVGKIGFPDELISTPYLELSIVQQRRYQSHISIAEGLLASIPPLQSAARILSQRHEVMDGSGYPNGIGVGEIDLSSSILSVVADYLCYCQGLIDGYEHPPAEALDQIKRQIGKRYDAKVYRAFEGIWPEVCLHFQRPVESSITVAEVKVGMVLARDVTAKNGSLLLAEGYEFESEMIYRLQRLEEKMQEKLEVHILDVNAES